MRRHTQFAARELQNRYQFAAFMSGEGRLSF
jgi:hypothetical protein